MKHLLLILFSFASCTVYLPDVHVATERTAAEKQLIGSFSHNKEFGSNNTSFYHYIFPFSQDSLIDSLTTDSIEFYYHMSILVEDHIKYLKDSLFVGESNTGYLEFLTDKQTDKDFFAVSKENSFRSYIINLYSKKCNVDEISAQFEFYSFNILLLQNNHFYKDKDGTWLQHHLK